MTTEQWIDYLKTRSVSEQFEHGLTDAEIFGWVTSGVGDDDDRDDVFAAFCEGYDDYET